MNYPVEFKPDVRYAYSTGRIRALETKLLSFSTVDKMINSTSIEDSLLYLEDTAYDNTIGELREPGDYGELVNRERKTAFNLMEKLIFDIDVKKLFRISFDFLNIKALLKGRFSKKDTSGILNEFGTVPLPVVKTAFETEKFSLLPDFMNETIGQALVQHHLEKDLKSIEFLIDSLEYKHLLFISQKTRNPFLINYVKITIDLTNISTFLRIKYFSTTDNLKNVLIDGGNLPVVFLENLKEEPLESLPSFFRSSPYSPCVDAGIKKISEQGSFATLDKERENYIISYIKLARTVTFGVEPVVAYFVAREADLNIIKMILLGKLNEIPNEKIRDRISVTFN